MNGRWAVAWAVAALVAAAFLIPVAASASSGGLLGVLNMSTPAPSPSLLWPCYDPKTYPPSRPPLTPPTAPGTPEPVMVANNYVQLRWAASSDADGLACYQVYEIKNGTPVKVATFGPGVTEGTFTVDYPPYGTATRVASLYIVAVDRWGAISPQSGTIQVTIHNDVVLPPSPTPSPSLPGPCHVSYSSYGWSGGLTSSVSITNTGSNPINGWRLTFTFPDPGQRLTNGWTADWSQTGSTVTATALSWNRTIAPGNAVTIGFNASRTGANPAPTLFQLNGAVCD
ncbi:cellulose-binding domain-containing protein [Sphaerisporangium dianthi]|uniref:Cellulose-binding domain-containing protein n=1 Tax=Sphaerisporangium dianthi TaxID=1436120 RepID=A0ABV9C7W2_9ACTN